MVPVYLTPAFDSPGRTKTVQTSAEIQRIFIYFLTSIISRPTTTFIHTNSTKSPPEQHGRPSLPLTDPGGLQVPFIEENEFPFAVVDGGFSLRLANLRHLTAPIGVLHAQAEEQGF